jgi:hypothetical protein
MLKQGSPTFGKSAHWRCLCVAIDTGKSKEIGSIDGHGAYVKMLLRLPAVWRFWQANATRG